MTISIKENRFHTTLFEKSQNLYLYIHPVSCHPPGCLKGLIYGNIRHITLLCSDIDDATKKIKDFYRRLCYRDYHADILYRLFQDAVKLYRGTRPVRYIDPDDMRSRIFFHLKYRPNDPYSRKYQSLFTKALFQPNRGATKLPFIENEKGGKLGITKMTVTYSRDKNIGELLSYRKLDKYTGPNVSSFLD